jgi:hypothetical protein
MDTAQPQENPASPAARAKQRLQELISQLQADAPQVTDPRTQAVFELSADVLGGLLKQFSRLDHDGHAHAFPAQAGSLKLHGDKGVDQNR